MEIVIEFDFKTPKGRQGNINLSNVEAKGTVYFWLQFLSFFPLLWTLMLFDLFVGC